jgi:glycerol-3-phosphate dehydrogenase
VSSRLGVLQAASNTKMNFPVPIRRPLGDERYHAIVIGGGINGVAIARACARAGKRTLLLEQHDFASGTTSRSTRIIHGGLRYLEHKEIGLVRESLRERERLLRQRPHLVHPIHFLLALSQNSRRSALSVRTGLWLYSRMGGSLGTQFGEVDQQKLERALDAGRRWSVFNFEDAQCEFPERLVAEWLVEAIEAGAVARNHAQVLAIDVRHGRAQGVLVRDEFTGKEERVEGTWIINASGPWVDRLCHRSRVNTNQRLIGGVRGSHIVLPRFAGASEAAVYAEALDGRPIFVVPWNDQLLVGTTEVADDGDPAGTQATAEEIQYLLRSLTQLFPKRKFSSHDIVHSFAGVRPLPYSRNQSPSAVTRRHFLHDHKDDGVANMISVIGGKLTTAAQLARECLAKIGLRARATEAAFTVADGNLDSLLQQWTQSIVEEGAIPETTAQAVVEWHGKRSGAIARLTRESTQMRAPLCSHTEHIVAEAVDAFSNQCAGTLGDVLLRRVPVALGACWSDACSRSAAMRIATVMRWSDAETAGELEAFENERAEFLRKPARSVLLQTAAD